MTAFLNQRGDESVLLVENRERKIDLFWLEADYLRAVAFDAICSPNTRGDGLPTLVLVVAQPEIGIVPQPIDLDEWHPAKVPIGAIHAQSIESLP